MQEEKHKIVGTISDQQKHGSSNQVVVRQKRCRAQKLESTLDWPLLVALNTRFLTEKAMYQDQIYSKLNNFDRFHLSELCFGRSAARVKKKKKDSRARQSLREVQTALTHYAPGRAQTAYSDANARIWNGQRTRYVVVYKSLKVIIVLHLNFG